MPGPPCQCLSTPLWSCDCAWLPFASYYLVCTVFGSAVAASIWLFLFCCSMSVEHMLQQSQGTQLLRFLFALLWPSSLRTDVVPGAVSMFLHRPTLCIECAGHAFSVAILYHRQSVAGSSSDSQDLDQSLFPCAGLCFSRPSLLSMFPPVHVLPCGALWFEWRLCANVSSTLKYSQKQHLHSFCMCRMLPLVAQCLLLCGPLCGELYFF